MQNKSPYLPNRQLWEVLVSLKQTNTNYAPSSGCYSSLFKIWERLFSTTIFVLFAMNILFWVIGGGGSKENNIYIFLYSP